MDVNQIDAPPGTRRAVVTCVPRTGSLLFMMIHLRWTDGGQDVIDTGGHAAQAMASGRCCFLIGSPT
jgi:hypothetical protein